MFRGIATVALLIISNAFMTLAWYGHIAFKSKLERFGLATIVLISWGIALFEGNDAKIGASIELYSVVNLHITEIK